MEIYMNCFTEHSIQMDFIIFGDLRDVIEIIRFTVELYFTAVSDVFIPSGEGSFLPGLSRLNERNYRCLSVLDLL